jgi:hypothetical protein
MVFALGVLFRANVVFRPETITLRFCTKMRAFWHPFAALNAPFRANTAYPRAILNGVRNPASCIPSKSLLVVRRLVCRNTYPLGSGFSRRPAE